MKGVWAQGDFVRMDPDTQGILFLGRSDGVLNPSGEHDTGLSRKD